MLDGNERIVRVNTSLGVEEIALLEYGRGPAWCVAWHGTGLVNRLSGWRQILPAERGRLVCAGLPGHGAVAPRPGDRPDWTPASFVEAGTGVLDLVAGETPVVLAGASLGGAVALGVALTVPERVRGVILLCPLVWGEVGGAIGLWAGLAGRPRLCRAVVSASLAGSRRSAWLAWLSSLAFVSDYQAFLANEAVRAQLDAGHAEYRLTPPDVLARTMCVVRDFDLRPAVAALGLDRPVLILHGTADRIVPIEQARWLAERLPQAELVSVRGAGHLPHAESQELVTRAIADWVGRLAA